MVPPRRPWALLNWLFWASLLLYPFFRFLVSMVSSGSSLTLASFGLVFFVGECWRGAPGRGAGHVWAARQVSSGTLPARCSNTCPQSKEGTCWALALDV